MFLNTEKYLPVFNITNISSFHNYSIFSNYNYFVVEVMMKSIFLQLKRIIYLMKINLLLDFWELLKINSSLNFQTFLNDFERF